MAVTLIPSDYGECERVSVVGAVDHSCYIWSVVLLNPQQHEGTSYSLKPQYCHHHGTRCRYLALVRAVLYL